jgi:hypothetical protein
MILALLIFNIVFWLFIVSKNKGLLPFVLYWLFFLFFFLIKIVRPPSWVAKLLRNIQRQHATFRPSLYGACITRVNKREENSSADFYTWHYWTGFWTWKDFWNQYIYIYINLFYFIFFIFFFFFEISNEWLLS